MKRTFKFILIVFLIAVFSTSVYGHRNGMDLTDEEQGGGLILEKTRF